MKQYDRIPYELLEIKTLEDKVKYICQNFKSVKKHVPSQSQSQNQIQSTSSGVSRKRPNISNINENSSDSDLTEDTSPRTTSEQDSSHCSRPPSKRRRLIDDPGLVITEKCENPNSQKVNMTPIKLILTSQPKDPTSSKYLQMSASKLFFGKDLSDWTNPELVAQGINETFGKSNISVGQVPDKAVSDIAGNLITQDLLDNLVNNCVGPQSFDMFPTLSSPSGSRAYSEEDCEIVPTDENRELNTPIPIKSLSKGRYDLRSNRKSGSNASAESKRKNEKPQILSNERVDILPKSALSQCRSELIELSDSDTETVTTTSQQQPHQQQQFYIQFPQSQQQQTGLTQFYDTTTGSILIVRYEDTQSQSQSQPQPLPLPQYQAATSTVDCLSDTITNSASTSNVIDGTQFTVNERSQLLSLVVANQNCTTISDSERKRLIVINGDDVDNEGSQTVQIDQQSSTSAESIKPVTKQSQETSEEQRKNVQIEKDKTDQVAQLKQISSQKVVTPKQLIKSNIPSSTRSLSTPRNKNPHVRVLDFNGTPNRYRLSEIDENKNESISNTSRFFNETPHNRSIASSLPSSAPPKVDSTVLRRRISTEKSIESSIADAFIPSDENTVISGDGETPKVRKTNRRGCVRSISSHKENHPDDERSKRVAKTKKKICHDDGDSNGSEQSNKKAEAKVTIPISAEDAMAEWQRARNASKNPELFEQQLREQNSKKQASEHSTVRKKRPTRSKKKPAATRKKQTNKVLPNDSMKPENISLNSTLDNNDTLNSTQLNLEARLLEENLKSAKKATPAKQTVKKSAKKKTPNRKLQIKLMPSPKNKSLKRLRSAKNLIPPNEKVKGVTNVDSIPSDKLNEAEVVAQSSSSSIANTVVESGLTNQMSIEAAEKTADLPNSKAIEASETLLKLKEIIKQQEIERKKPQNKEIQHESISMSQPPTESVTESIVTFTNEPTSNDKFTSVLLNNVNQPNLSMSSLLETPFKDCGSMFPRTPNLGNMLSQLNTP